MKTLAQFKRDAASGKMSMEIIERFGSADIIERLRGIRKVAKVNSVGIVLINQDGQESSLDLKCASLVEYDGDTLIVYNPGYREPTQQEQQVLNGWQKEQEEYYKACPYGNAYWKMKDYFAKSPCPWMAGFETVRGKYYTNGKVRDNRIKGDAILKYKLYMDD